MRDRKEANAITEDDVAKPLENAENEQSQENTKLSKASVSGGDENRGSKVMERSRRHRVDYSSAKVINFSNKPANTWVWNA